MSEREHPIDADYIDDGGPVYPVVLEVLHVEDEEFYRMESSGISLRDHFAVNAPREVIDSISGTSIGDVCRFLGMEKSGYQYATHHPAADTKARYIYADAMLQARKNK